MKILDRPDIMEKLNATIDKRYRKKGYEINYLVFKDRDVAGLEVVETDKIIKTDITFEEHTTPIKKDVYTYPDNKHVEKELGEVNELVVCGFHYNDCVKRVAAHFFNSGIDTLVDVELTELFRFLCSRFYFDEENYNLANMIEYGEAELTFLYGESRSFFNMDKIYGEPYYKRGCFIPTIKKDEIIDMMEEKEQHKSR